MYIHTKDNAVLKSVRVILCQRPRWSLNVFFILLRLRLDTSSPVKLKTNLYRKYDETYVCCSALCRTHLRS